MSDESGQSEAIPSLYDILGCDKNASPEEIKQAYRRRARQLHPDRNQDDPNATAKFQQLAQAYEILKDPVKRDQYDRLGVTDAMDTSIGESNPFDILGQIIGLKRSRGPPNGPKVAPTIRIIRVPMKVAYNGGQVTKTLHLFQVCSVCHGTGSCDGVEYPICEQCHGSGSVFPTGNLAMLFPCKACNKVGYMVPPEKVCLNCNGHKIVQMPIEIEVPIEIGMPEDEPIVMPGKGDEYPGKETADLYLIPYIAKQNGLIRNGDDLFYVHNISNIELANGTSFSIKTLDDRKLYFCTQKGKKIDVNRICKVPNEGFPCRNNVQMKGNLYIRFSPPLFGIPGAVVFPFLEFGRAIASEIRSLKNPVFLDYMPIEEQEYLYQKERESGNLGDNDFGYFPRPPQQPLQQ